MPPPGDAEPVSYQSLYRRFRPQRFDEVLGQEHVSLALRNAVRDARVGHAYLFSGPRGTGKTSTARILAKALDCESPSEGEPCGVCASCIEIARGTSMDVHELDAASNNGVEAMRDLVAHSALGTPGRWKVYIVDEVHMLSTAASNSLLKTLEEPPAHVVFVLATTDAQKVLPTIRSRTQHFEFRLLGPEVLAGLLRRIRDEAELEVPDEAVNSAVRRGRGSARDALSALDQVAAGGTIGDEIVVLADIAGALAERDAAGVLIAVAKASDAGHDAQRLAAELADYLRQGFLAMLSPDLVSMVGDEKTRVEETARRMGLPAVVRAMEALGRALVDMRDAPDPRVHLEATLIRLAHPELDDSSEALLERLERVERAIAAGDLVDATATTAAVRTVAAPTPSPEGKPPPSRARGGNSGGESPQGRGSAPDTATDANARDGAGAGRVRRVGKGPAGDEDPAGDDVPAGAEGGVEPVTGGPELARRALGALRGAKAAGRPGPSGPSSPQVRGGPGGVQASATLSGSAAEPRTAGATATLSSPSGVLPSRDELVQVWGDGLLASLPGRARARFRVGRFVATEAGEAVFALPNETHRSYCEEVRPEVESALGECFGTAVPLRLVVDEDAAIEQPVRPGTDLPPAAVGPRAAGASMSGAAATRVGRQPSTSGAPRPQGAPAGEAAQDAEVEPDLLDPVVFEAETEPAGAGPSPEERIKLAFPGAEEV